MAQELTWGDICIKLGIEPADTPIQALADICVALYRRTEMQQRELDVLRRNTEQADHARAMEVARLITLVAHLNEQVQGMGANK